MRKKGVPCSSQPLTSRFLREDRVPGGVDLHIGRNQDIIADSDRLIVDKRTVHIDDHIAADKNIFPVVAVKGHINRHIFPDISQQRF